MYKQSSAFAPWNEIDRRSLLVRLGLLSTGALVGPSLLSCGREVVELNFWGTGTLDIGERCAPFPENRSS